MLGSPRSNDGTPKPVGTSNGLLLDSSADLISRRDGHGSDARFGTKPHQTIQPWFKQASRRLLFSEKEGQLCWPCFADAGGQKIQLVLAT